MSMGDHEDVTVNIEGTGGRILPVYNMGLSDEGRSIYTIAGVVHRASENSTGVRIYRGAEEGVDKASEEVTD